MGVTSVKKESAPSLEILRAAENQICDAIKRNKGTGAFWVFGSVARGESVTGSDYDLLVDFLPGASYFDVATLEIELTELLGNPVEVMSTKSEGYAADHARSQAVLVSHGF